LPIAERARARGVTVIDCPVSGGVSGAAAGTLTLLCGGEAAAIEAQRPLLEAVSANVFHLGPLGAGLVGKVANNLIIGIGRRKMLRSLEGAILRGEYPPATFLGLKDLTAAVESGRSVHQAMPVTSLARELYQLIDTKLGGLHGSNEVLRYYLEP